MFEQWFNLKRRHRLLFSIFTTPLAWLYGCVVRLRNMAYDAGLLKSVTLNAPVISIGNIAAGGTGKTPFTIYVCELLQRLGQRPAIVTRGYRSGLRKGDSVVYLNGKQLTSANQAYADEAMLQSMKLKDVPVIVGANRSEAVSRFLSTTKTQPTVWVLDDGFQHRRVKRDIDIVVLGELSAEDDFSVLPKSTYREPIAALGRSHVVVVSDDSNQETIHSVSSTVAKPLWLSHVFNDGLKPVSEKAQRNPPADIGTHLALICAIANPSRFERSVESLGYRIKTVKKFSDHLRIDKSMIADVLALNLPIVITEKDYYRNSQFWISLDAYVYTLPIHLKLISQDETKFLAVLTALISK